MAKNLTEELVGVVLARYAATVEKALVDLHLKGAPSANSPSSDIDAYLEALERKVLDTSHTLDVPSAFKAAAAGNDYSLGFVSDIAETLLKESDISFDSDSLEFRRFCHLMTSVQRHLSGYQQQLREGECPDAYAKKAGINTHPVAAPEAKEPIKPLFSEVYDDFIESKVSRKDKKPLSEVRQREYRAFYEVWSLFMDDKPIDRYSRTEIRGFLVGLYDMPLANRKPYSRMSWAERVALAKCERVPEEDRIAPKTVSAYRKWIQGVFRCALDLEYIYTSPVIKLGLNEQAKSYGAFKDGECRSLVDCLSSLPSSWEKWTIFLAIYTGARRGELAQLRKCDVKEDAEIGIFYLDINDSGEGSTLKTDAASRIVPLHNDIATSGFLDYVASIKNIEELLFPEVQGAPWKISKYFSGFRDSLGISALHPKSGKRRPFHSFRHTVVTNLRRKAGSDSLHHIQMIVGHKRQRAGVTDVYTHEFPLSELAEVMNKLDYGT
ncbi:tyrosine-type recombinase/integrase [Microbulbifer sp. TRSA005]|uniref:tyrosine-type recombinase/integrase n=1 Tax=Microbulbifer sp. TRSA005 TaxID=3243383 RepID=UPI0040395933